MLLVHAHPDDESIGTGATMAKYAAEGAGVTLITCTLGELGEVIPPDLAYLAADAEGGLGEYRIGELEAACAALDVTDHRFLGGACRWHDSGMMGLASNDAPGSFWRADVDEAAGELLAVIREVRPQVLISYDDNGFYGHPDHIQAHRVARRAFELADGLVTQVLRHGSAPLGADQAVESLRNSRQQGSFPGGAPDFTEVDSVNDLPFGAPDEQVTTEIDATAYLDQDRGDAGARHPDRRGEPVLRPLRPGGSTGVRPRVLHAAGGHPRSGERAARLGDRPVRRDWLAF